MGTAGTRYGELRTALRTGSYGLARDVAASLPHVDLKDALRLTMLAAQEDPAHFEALARRWLERFISEKQPALQLVKWVAEDLGNIGDPQCPGFLRQDSEGRLRELLGKL